MIANPWSAAAILAYTIGAAILASQLAFLEKILLPLALALLAGGAIVDFSKGILLFSFRSTKERVRSSAQGVQTIYVTATNASINAPLTPTSTSVIQRDLPEPPTSVGASGQVTNKDQK